MCTNEYLHVCMCTMRMCFGAYGSQKRALYPQELELQMTVNCHVGARNQTQVFRRGGEVLKYS